jgi:uncharacterized protein with HEPN domain
MRRDTERLLDILEAIDNVLKYADRGEETFQQDELVRVWVLYHLQIIGEAMFKIPGDVRERHPAIPWRRFIALRNIFVHEYFGIDLRVAWQTVAELPELRSLVEAMHKEMTGDSL